MKFKIYDIHNNHISVTLGTKYYYVFPDFIVVTRDTHEEIYKYHPLEWAMQWSIGKKDIGLIVAAHAAGFYFFASEFMGEVYRIQYVSGDDLITFETGAVSGPRALYNWVDEILK